VLQGPAFGYADGAADVAKLVVLSLIILLSVATAHAQRNRDLKHAADDIQAARTLPDYTPPPTERCDLNSKTCKLRSAQELSRACGHLSVASVANKASIERCRKFRLLAVVRNLRRAKRL
jgi:hypothetical protein